VGRCKFHAGCCPSHQVSAGRERALAFARDQLGAEVAQEPKAALLQAVRLASGIVHFNRARLAKIESPSKADEAALADAVLLQSRVSAAALQAGVEERAVEAVTRMAEVISLAAEQGLAPLALTPEQRTTFAREFDRALRHLEDEPIEGTAVEVKDVRVLDPETREITSRPGG
jgi:hypothetical protein